MQNRGELKAYFSCVRETSSHEMKCRARIILGDLSNSINFLYLTFALPLIMDFERINAFFQATNCDPEQMVKELNMCYHSLMDRVCTRQNTLWPADHVNFGAKFLHETREYLKQGNTPERQTMIIDIKKIWHNMLMEALSQVKTRLPPVKGVFDGLSYLSPAWVLRQSARAPLEQLPFLSSTSSTILKWNSNIGTSCMWTGQSRMFSTGRCQLIGRVLDWSVKKKRTCWMRSPSKSWTFMPCLVCQCQSAMQ